MHTRFTAEQLRDPDTASAEVELRACLQCGYCMDNCPTYQMLGDENDSPRGRIALIKAMLEDGGRPDPKAVPHIDQCLHCLACLATCPSSVNYMHLIDHARERIERHYRRPLWDRAFRAMLARVVPYPARLRGAMRGARLVKPLAAFMPRRARGILEQVPRRIPAASRSEGTRTYSALGERRRRVALLTGCAQSVLDTEINDATIRILRRHGCEVVVPENAGCCGAFPYHMGKAERGRNLAAQNIRAWMGEVNDEGLDAVVINTSGCGTVVKDYEYMFRTRDLSEEAATISALAKDVCEVLADIGLELKDAPQLRVAYHATCSLQYGQRIRYMPKRLLKSAGFRVIEPGDSHTCCGAGGPYQLLQPELSAELKDRKVRTLQAGAPDVIAAGNIGCMSQIRADSRVPVVHTVQLLDWATGGPRPGALSAGERPAV